MPVLSIPRKHGETSTRFLTAMTWAILIGLFVWCFAMISRGDATDPGTNNATSNENEPEIPGAVPIWIYVGPTTPGGLSDVTIVLDAPVPAGQTTTVLLSYIPLSKVNTGNGEFKASLPFAADEQVKSFRIPVLTNTIPTGERYTKVTVMASVVDNTGAITQFGTDTLLVKP